MERGAVSPNPTFAESRSAAVERDAFKPARDPDECFNALSLLALSSDRLPAVPLPPMAEREIELREVGCPRRGHKYVPPDARAELKKNPPPDSALRNGDIVFQSSAEGDGLAIQLITKSPLTHCGVLFKEGDDWYVYEAVRPVKKTLLKDFAKNGDDEKYVVRRLKDADHILTDKVLNRMHSYLKQNVGKEYDDQFAWSDDRLYCSEYVWKAYRHSTGLKVGQPKRIGDYDLSNPDVKKRLKEQFGDNIPLKERAIGPGGVFDSRLLKTVR